MSHTPSKLKQANAIKSDKRLNKRLKDTPIAIVGMASILANARYLNQFWDLICEKIDAIIEVPASHWRSEDYYDADKTQPDKSYCKRGGFMPEVDFNPLEFGLPPNILELTDSSQLLSLVVAKEVLADANLPADYDRDRIGITLGVGGGQKIGHSLNARLQYPVLKKVFSHSGLSDADSDMLIKKFQDQYIHWEENSFPGSLGNVIAGRIANRFDLGGMNCVVDAACAGSLAAMRMALTELTEGRSDMMLTGGVCTDNSPYMYMSFSKTPAFTTNDTIQPFDIDSKGMMIGEGIGMVALKRLEDAEREGDRIYAVIKGIGASSDGKFKSIYAPRPEGQAKALARAYDDAGFAPHTVGLIEAHGTGTAAGDVAEFKGLASVFAKDNQQLQHIALGSVKSQIGHTKSTAGTAGLIKAALALHHKVLPPTINVSQPNPKLNITQSPFYINSQTRPWFPDTANTPRRAGISSFGFGGTNFHIVLEEYQREHPRSAAYRQRHVPQSLLFAASNQEALTRQLQAALQHIEHPHRSASHSLRLLAEQYPLRALPEDAARLGLVAQDIGELQQLLIQAISQLNANPDKAWQWPSGLSYRPRALVTGEAPEGSQRVANKVAALFAGQGAQYLNMGCELACHFPEMRQQIMASDKVFDRHAQTPLSRILYPIPAFDDTELKAQNAKLTHTLFAQSAIGALSMAQYSLLTQAGFRADMLAGHSFGELSALCAAGVITNADYVELAFARGHAMAELPAAQDGQTADPGTMFAVIFKPEDKNQLTACLAQFANVHIANYNAPTQWVIAGGTAETKLAASALSELGFKVIALPVSGAFHTPLVAHAQQPFAKAIDNTSFSAPKIPVYANGTGQLHPQDAQAIKADFKQHMLQSVRFSEQLQAMYAAGARVFVEFGPKNTLQKLAENTLSAHLSELCLVSINPNPQGDSDRQLRIAAVQLAVAGITLMRLDPYQATCAEDIGQEGAPSAMNIKLNATNYVSPATQAKMANSLATGHVTPQVQWVDRIVEKEVEKEVIVEKLIEKTVEKVVLVENTMNNNHNSEQTPLQPSTLSSNANRDVLSAFFSAQTEAAQLHQQFLAIPKQYGETFTALMIEQAKMASQGITIPESLQRSMELFHQHQAQTLQSHTEFLQQQSRHSQAALALLTQAPMVASEPLKGEARTLAFQPQERPFATQSAPSSAYAHVTPPPVAHQSVQHQPLERQTFQPQPNALATPVLASAPRMGADNAQQTGARQTALQHTDLQQNNIQQTNVQQTMLAVVADKTGYPTDMLELSMDMEADLGIDSIKRVEILGTVQDALPDLPELNPSDLAECRTLGEIVNYMNANLPAASLTATAAANTDVTAATRAVPVAQILPEKEFATTKQDGAEIERTMLAVVADKTGYPADMLELSMDMEADLGIDSIKRVEILGTVQDALPGLPELNPSDLAECRTLGEIVNYMNANLPAASLTVTAAANTDVTAPVAQILPEKEFATTTQDGAEIERTMLAVVADKTGYPTDMLELSMDMEADLGIDSIKRVEILGTVQDALPGLPELNPSDLAECRTLGEIVALFSLQREQAKGDPSQNTAANGESLTRATEAIIDLPPHSEVVLKKLPAAAEFTQHPAQLLTKDLAQQALPRPFAKDACMIIADDGHHAGILAEKLQAHGITVAVVRSPNSLVASASPLDSHIASFSLAAINDASIHAVVNEIKTLGKIAGFIHLQPQHKTSADAQGVVLSNAAKASVEQAFLFAKHLQPLLTKEAVAPEAQRCFISVSRIDGGFGYLNHSLISHSELNQAALTGLTKTLSHEWPNVHCRALDIAPHLDAKQVANAIMAELFATDKLTEVGVSDAAVGETDARLTRMTLVPGNATIRHPPANITRADNILVTGGAKGVTFECALSLAKRCKAHFILAGRSRHLAIPTWAQGKKPSELNAAAIAHIHSLHRQGIGEKPTPKQVNALVWPVQSSLEITAALQAFSAVGASAEYLTFDVNNPDEIASTLVPKTQLSAITGIIHGAGVLADKHIQDKTLDELARVYGTKVTGLSHLLGALDLDKLTLIALFSSAAGFYGNVGQSDYAMANDILNKAALQLAQQLPKAKVMSFDWGPWDGGMVNAALKTMFMERGVYVIPLKAGAELFANQLLSHSGAQLLIGTDMQGNAAQSNTATPATAGRKLKKPAADRLSDAADPHALSHAGALTTVTPSPITLQRTLAPNTMIFIEDHCINAHPVLPTVCAIQWMREAAFDMLQQHVKVQDYKLLKGVIFDTGMRQHYTHGALTRAPITLALKLTPVVIAPLNSVQIDALISVDGRPHYQARLVVDAPTDAATTRRHPLKTTAVPDVAALAAITTARELYHDGTLFHGPRLQGISSVLQCDASGLIAKVSLPQVALADCGEFAPNLAPKGSQVFAEDLLLQAMLVWTRLNYGAASLPSSIGEFISHAPLAFGADGYLVLEVVKHSSRALEAHIALYHQDGRISCEMHNAKVTISKNLNSAFLANQPMVNQNALNKEAVNKHSVNKNAQKRGDAHKAVVTPEAQPPGAQVK